MRPKSIFLGFIGFLLAGICAAQVASLRPLRVTECGATVAFSELEARLQPDETKLYYCTEGRYTGKAIFPIEDHHGAEKRFEYLLEDGRIVRQVGFFEDGSISRDFNFRAGKEHGKFVMYYSNGQRYIEQYFIDGALEGKIYRWDREGNLLEEAIYSRGKLVKQIK